MKNWLICFCLIALGPLSAQTSQEFETQKKAYDAHQINPHPPAIDGIPDDIIWTKAPLEKGFIQSEPDEGKAPSEETAFQIAYDEKNLYVAIYAYDNEPDKITSQVTRRDDGENADVVAILIDSYHDLRTGFEFSVNAAGVKIDAIWSDDGDNRDYNWDPIWYVKTHKNHDGWVAEMRIPLNQLRFGQRDEHTWGLQIARYIHRHREWSMWQLIPQEVSGFVSHMGELRGIKDLANARRVEILPYVVGLGESFPAEEGNVFRDGRAGKISGGLDGKIGITSDLTLDFTVNPDFGQVEADPSEVNLTAFESFFAEKRPFFIEGRNIFQYTMAIGDGPNSRETLFYSRRIGRRPFHYPDLDDDQYADVPANTSIIGAAKVTGKTKNGLSIGVLEALTVEERAEIDINGERSFEAVEPATNYFVGRLKKDLNDGNTVVGAMLTAVNRDISGESLQSLNDAGYSAGLDYGQQWDGKNYFLDLKTAFSRVEGDTAAINRLQRAPQHFFQRPDAKHLDLDTTLTAMQGYGGSLSFGKVGGGHWRWVVGNTWRSPGFEVNDIGYLRRADQINSFLWIAYREWRPTLIFNDFQVNYNVWSGANWDLERTYAGTNINGGGRFKNFWRFWSGINRDASGLDAAALRGGPMLKYDGAWNFWWNVQSDSRKNLRVGMGSFSHLNDDNLSFRHNFFVDMSWRPSNATRLTAEPFYQRRVSNLQYVATENYEAIDTDRYIFGHLDQRTLGIELRAEFSMTPTLSVQYYGQPFVSAGHYSKFKWITASRAEKMEDRYQLLSGQTQYLPEDEQYVVDEDLDGNSDYRFDQPDFNFQQFRSNLVIRWEYMPGSTIFLVWTQNRTESYAQGEFRPQNDLENILSSEPDNVFLVKWNYWFAL